VLEVGVNEVFAWKMWIWAEMSCTEDAAAESEKVGTIIPTTLTRLLLFCQDVK
jgi:hypothetical protein